MSDFITKDSGERAQFESGMQRDTEAGKPRFDLMIPLDVPYAEQMITRLAALYGRGAVKYEERNWEQADSEAEMARMKSSAFRHFMQWLTGERDEDHAAAAMFNIIAFETTRYKVEKAREHDDAVSIMADESPEPVANIAKPRIATADEVVGAARQIAQAVGCFTQDVKRVQSQMSDNLDRRG